MKNNFIHIILFILIFSACREKDPGIITFELKRSDYLEVINAPGTVQAVNNNFLVTPRIYVSNLTIVHLTEEGAYVKKGDTICIISSPDLDNNFESFTSDLEKMEAEQRSLVADNAMQLSLLEAQVETNNAQMEITMLDSIQIKFAPPVKQKLLSLEMEKVTIEKMKLQKKLAAQKIIDKSELMQIGSRIAMQKNRIQVIQQQINSLTMVSPADGMVVHVVAPMMMFMSSTGMGTLGGKIEEGSMVWSNMSVLQIPDLKVMQVSVEVPETDYKRIEEKQQVVILVDAATNLETTGKVKRKSLAGKNAEEKSSIRIYEVIVSVDSCHLKMKPGLSARCRIIIDHVKDTIVVPAAAIFVKDSSRIVYVAAGHEFIPTTVETGLSNSSMTIISKGLEGNETIALVEPPHKLIRKEANAKKYNADNYGFLGKDSLINKPDNE